MKTNRFFPFVLIFGALVLSACGAGIATPVSTPEASASAKVDALPVSFVGIVDSIADDQWVISGTTVTVNEDVVRDGPFKAGDRIKVEGLVNPNGSFIVTRVEAPTPQETATLPPFSDDNTNESAINDNTNDGNINDDNSNGVNANDDNGNDDNSNDSNTNDDNGGGNTNDDNSNDDNGGNSNDDNSNDDDRGNSNDDNDNDDNSGKGGGDDDKDENDNDD